VAVTSAVTATGTVKLLDAALGKAQGLAATIRGIFTKAHPEAVKAAEAEAPAVDMHQVPSGADHSPAETIKTATETATDSATEVYRETVTEALGGPGGGTKPPKPPGPPAGDDGGSVYRDAVSDALDETRGGLPATSTSYSRLQAAQKALDKLTAQGVTGFTDKAGKNWNLSSYVEMATRTAVSARYNDLQNAALEAAGVDLVWTYTVSTEGSCELCIPWLDRPLSLSGDTVGNVGVTDAGGNPVTHMVAGSLDDAKDAGFLHISCRCEYQPYVDGTDFGLLKYAGNSPIEAAQAYEASQAQRGFERKVRAAASRAAVAITPEAKAKAKADLKAAKAASKAHRESAGVVMTQVGVERRERAGQAR
jgi:hypothetical protein